MCRIRAARAVLAGAAAALVLAGCASLRPPTPVSQVPPGDYEVRVLSALAPVKQPDGEVVAAVVYSRSGRQIEVWDEPAYWLTNEALGKGTGSEHLKLVRSPANYQTVSLTGPDGSPVGYAVLHRRGVSATVQDAGAGTLLVLSVREFLDPNYIQPDRDGRETRRRK